MVLKPVKINLNNGTARGMYILLTKDEIRYTKDNETRPPNRAYKIEVAVEAMHSNKRCRGKSTFSIVVGTSISKAVSSLLGKKEKMKETLRLKGTLKVEKVVFEKIDTKDRKFKSLYNAWINNKKITTAENTVKAYNGSYTSFIEGSKLDKKSVDDFTVDDIQNLIHELINRGIKPKTISLLKIVIKNVLDINDVQLNWKKIVLPKIVAKEKFSGTDDEAKLIAKTLLEYKHPVARGVFSFLLSGRRIGETLLMEHKHIDYTKRLFTLPAENTKAHTEVKYQLTPLLINAIKSQKTTKGLIFGFKHESIMYHFKKAMGSIGVHNMVMHDLRSMVAVTALRNGANIYSVSKMLSHKNLSTTEGSYLGSGSEMAAEAQDTFTALLAAPDDVIDVEIEEDKFTVLRNLYPNASDEKIYKIIEMMK
ncbi:tyrosine-type recombinase/integrase [Candidatus Sulfurimonas baltica]|uniref:Tyrosine-type recombinase/integrase n=1 Tax=Candidatus Sulfurimonas baltica TaxID=2740404 RepID=A0A7S7LU53_9BACT|nr:tyrosine-type recombinase/integrase [Candidatus Sulfurimonas baltica]QOY51367.1 tyrosine-type recombinase/integrase [Candidatus Sulfurimonas baltica]